MNLRATVLCLLITLPLWLNAAMLEPDATWNGSTVVPTEPAWNVQLLSSNSSGTTLLLECEGFWTQQVEQNGVMATQVLLPESGTLTEIGLPELPALSRLIAIPDDRRAEIIIRDVVYETYPCPNPYLVLDDEATYQTSGAGPEEIYPFSWAEVEEPGILKDFRVAPVNLFPIRYDEFNQELMLATRLEVEIQTVQPATENIKSHHARKSQAFTPLYEALIDNYEEFNTSAPIVGEGSRGEYLIIVDDRQDASIDSIINVLGDWKRELGYYVVIKDLTEIGSTRDDIKEAILEEYYGSDIPLDYVLLVGDIDATIAIPSYTIVKPTGGDPDVTDHPYTMLEGNDYFPDILIGRFSVHTLPQLATVIWKTIFYQKLPQFAGTDWLTRALLAAGNYADSGLPPVTPRWTSLWLCDKLYEHGYTQVDTVFYWEENTQPGTALITNSLNNGVGLVGYRGWADASGWQFPAYNVDDIYDLTNIGYQSVMVSMVCNTGDFGNTDVDPCFGEAWVRAGSQFSRIGGTAFVGPSDLHTNTKWNNALYAGFFEGLLEENLYRIGQATLRAKVELYYGFPEDIGTGDDVEFYFHVYNILGDPELQIWTGVPGTLSLDVQDELILGRQTVTASVADISGTPLGGAYIAFYKQDEVLAGGVTGSDGVVTVEIEPLTEGDLTVTASKENYVALQEVVQVTVDDFPLGITDLEIDGDGVFDAGETAQMTLTLTNYGSSSLSSVTAHLATVDNFVTITQGSSNLGDVSASSEVEAVFTLSSEPDCPNGHIAELTLTLTDGSSLTKEIKFLETVGGLFFIPAGCVVENGSLEPGDTADLRISINNAGSIEADQPTATLSCSHPAVNVTADQSAFPVLLPGAVGSSQSLYTVEIAADALIGTQAVLDFAISTSAGYTQHMSYPVQLGEPASTDPLGPDSYGYYAYDDTDTEYAEAPVYNWLELDPDKAGTFDQHLQLDDDTSELVDLPFTFTFYGQDYDEITVCSNGWISMGETWMANFRNWNLPSALGPPALIAPFWDDLVADTTGGIDTLIHIYTRHDAAEDRFIIEWTYTINRFGYENFSTWHVETFELILFDPAGVPTMTGDGEIVFQYQVVNNVDDNNNYATVGIEDAAHRRGLQYTYSNDYPSAAAPLADGRAIKLTTDAPSGTSDAKQGRGEPGQATLFAPIPNPANPTALLTFSLPHAGIVTLDLYNTLGQQVASLVNERTASGMHQVTVGGSHLASGIYFVKMTFENQVQTQKVLILK